MSGFVGWRWDDAASGERVPGGVDITGIRHYCGHFQGTPDLLVVESNYFPVVSPWYSISINVAAQSVDDSPVRLTFGLVGFDGSYIEQVFYTSDQYPSLRVTGSVLSGNVATLTTDGAHGFRLGDDIVVSGVGAPYDGTFVVSSLAGGQNVVSYALTHVDIASDTAAGIITAKRDISVNDGNATEGYLHLTGLMPILLTPPAEMCLRIEAVNCADLWLDNCMVDPHEGQYEYFDGSSKSSFIDDFIWMGGADQYQNRQFSLWYNNYKNTRQRLISEFDEADNVYKPGLVEEWAPTGANVIPHWNAVTSFTPLNWQGDAFYPVRDVVGTPVSVPTSRVSFQGVPWPPA